MSEQPSRVTGLSLLLTSLIAVAVLCLLGWGACALADYHFGHEPADKGNMEFYAKTLGPKGTEEIRAKLASGQIVTRDDLKAAKIADAGSEEEFRRREQAKAWNDAQATKQAVAPASK
jgi:hypothetical protein